MQLTSFCTSWILAVSSRVVSRSLINFLLENVSNVDPWNRFNSSISLRLFSWASRRSRFCSDNCSRRSCWSRRSCSSHARVWSISLRCDSIIPFNSWIHLLPESAWNSCLWISALKSARICSFCRSSRILICSFSELRHGFCLTFESNESNSSTGLPVLTWPTDNEWLDNKLSQESGKLVYSPLVLLAPEWTVVKRALCRWCSHWSLSHASSRACCRWRTPAWKFQWSLRSGSRWRIWAHNLWEGRCWPKSQAPHSRKRTEFSPNRPTWKMKMKIRRMKQKMRETGKGQSGESKRGQNAQPHETWMTWRALHLESMSRATLWNLCANTRKCDVWGCFLHIECNPSKHDQGMMQVVPNQLVYWVLSTSDQYFVSFQPISGHPHTQIRTTLFLGVRINIPN